EGLVNGRIAGLPHPLQSRSQARPGKDVGVPRLFQADGQCSQQCLVESWVTCLILEIGDQNPVALPKGKGRSSHGQPQRSQGQTGNQNAESPNPPVHNATSSFGAMRGPLSRGLSGGFVLKRGRGCSVRDRTRGRWR